VILVGVILDAILEVILLDAIQLELLKLVAPQ
jgi:hypothetical protein